MKKSLLFIFFCCMSFVAKAQTIEEIEILTAKDIVPTSIVDVPPPYERNIYSIAKYTRSKIYRRIHTVTSV